MLKGKETGRGRSWEGKAKERRGRGLRTRQKFFPTSTKVQNVLLFPKIHKHSMFQVLSP